MFAERIVPLFILASLAAAASASEPSPAILDGPASSSAIYAAVAKTKDCQQVSCVALRDIAEAFRALSKRDVPNTMVHLNPPARDPAVVADRTISHRLLAHPERSAEYCGILSKLAAHYSEWSVGMVTIELANRIDGAHQDRCTSLVLAAFPVSDETTRLVKAARESCEAAPRSGCQRDRRR